MKKLLQGRSLLYASVAIVCVYTVLIALFTKGDAIEVFNNTYLIIPFHILILYGIVRFADYCLQKQKVIIRSAVRILFTILLVLAQLPFVIRYIAKIMHNNEEVLTAMNTLKRDGLFNFDIEQILLYQLPWVVMLCVLFIKYIQPAPNKSYNQIYGDTTDVHEATSSNPTQIKNVQNFESLTTTNNEDVARMIRLKTRRRLQTFGIFMLALFAYAFAMIGGFGGRWSSDSGILIISSYGLFGWFAIRVVLDIFSFVTDAVRPIVNLPNRKNSLSTITPTTSIPMNTSQDGTIELTKYDSTMKDSTPPVDAKKQQLGFSQVIIEFFSFSRNSKNTNTKVKFIVYCTLILIVLSQGGWFIPMMSGKMYLLIQLLGRLSIFANVACCIYGLYYLVTSKRNKGFALIIAILPFIVHRFIYLLYF